MCVLPVCMYTGESSHCIPGVWSSEGALDTMEIECCFINVGYHPYKNLKLVLCSVFAVLQGSWARAVPLRFMLAPKI